MSSVYGFRSNEVTPRSWKPSPWYPASRPAIAPNFSHAWRASTAATPSASRLSVARERPWTEIEKWKPLPEVA